MGVPGVKTPYLGGGNSNILGNFHPDTWGFMIQFDGCIFFRWVGEKPPTRNPWRWLKHRRHENPWVGYTKFPQPKFKHLQNNGLCTPPKINGWNLEMMVSNRNLLFQGAPIFRWTMFVLGGVCFLRLLNLGCGFCLASHVYQTIWANFDESVLLSSLPGPGRSDRQPSTTVP